MYVTYNNLFKLLIDKGLNKTEFAREVGISSNTLAKLSKNELVSLEVLVRICRQLDCSLGDVVQLAPPEPPIKSGLERMKKRRPTHEKGGNAAPALWKSCRRSSSTSEISSFCSRSFCSYSPPFPATGSRSRAT